ncbi:type I restriction enzyme HsdR N-terminal domain-containing protein [Halobaculum sp. MBLA0147]|uniref:type I restriction enzyme HsdR N-terminal domain-containing protein n=1 Tax=Halobaculum sp. MBLA0147 TaxID=3079934 RepID=UPI003525613D
MDRSAVNDYVEQSRRLVEASPQMDEENTKVRLVQPFLDLLGWDLRSTEVELEYTVRFATRTTHVDYALVVGDSPVVFVEAKPVRSELTDDDVEQLRSYMRQELAVDWGVLTNGTDFEVLSKNSGADGEVSVVEFDLDDLADDPEVLELLTKESIQSGRSAEVAAQVAETNNAIEHLRESETVVAEAVAEAVETETGDLPVDTTEQAREFVRDLVAVLEDRRQFVTEAHVPADDEAVADGADDPGDGDVDAGTYVAASDASDFEAADAFDGSVPEGYAVAFDDGWRLPAPGGTPPTEQQEAMGLAVDHLIAAHDLTTRIDLPYATPRATKNCLLNTSADHPDGRRMRAFYELVDGTFLYTSLSVDDKKRRLELLASEVGLDVAFAGEW